MFDGAVEFAWGEDEAFAVFFGANAFEKEHKELVGEAFDGAAFFAFVEDGFVGAFGGASPGFLLEFIGGLLFGFGPFAGEGWVSGFGAPDGSAVDAGEFGGFGDIAYFGVGGKEGLMPFDERFSPLVHWGEL